MRRLLLVFALGLIACNDPPAARSSPGATAGDAQHVRVEKLLARVEAATITFLRNGNPHSAQEAADHLRAKYRRARSAIRTAEQFIAEHGTKSSTTGERYRVRHADGREQDAAAWLTEQLALISA
jgi:hypothetical protein